LAVAQRKRKYKKRKDQRNTVVDTMARQGTMVRDIYIMQIELTARNTVIRKQNKAGNTQ
jgi:hypothetical protein